MKRIISITLALLICILAVLTATGCSFGNPIEKFSKKMENADSYEMVVTMNLSSVGRVIATMQFDGELNYTSYNTDLIPDTYTKNVEEYVVTYTETGSGKWLKTIEENKKDEGVFDLDAKNILNPDNYEKVKGENGVYKQKKDVVFENFDDVVLTVSGESLVIEAKTTAVGSNEMDVKIVISKINEVTVTLPDDNDVTSY